MIEVYLRKNSFLSLSGRFEGVYIVSPEVDLKTRKTDGERKYTEVFTDDSGKIKLGEIVSSYDVFGTTLSEEFVPEDGVTTIDVDHAGWSETANQLSLQV